MPLAYIQEVATVHEQTDPPAGNSSDSATNNPTDQAEKDVVLNEIGISYGHGDLSVVEKERLRDLLYDNRDIFATSLADLPGTNIVTHTIETTGPPIRAPVFRHSQRARDEIEKQLKSMLEHGIVRPCFSLWSAPVILVSKKDDISPRFVIDLRALNAQSKPIFYPLPNLPQILDELAEKRPKYFSSLDLRSGYWQLNLDPDSQLKTAFVTSSGCYCFQRLPFGLAGAAGSFQRLMQTVLRAELNDFVLCYLDDILIYSSEF